MPAKQGTRGDWDVLVIGSGIGGLTAGAYLAGQGARVLVCEQARKPGGCFNSFTRKGYTFDGGIQGCEDIGLLLPILRQLGLDKRIELRRSRPAFAMPGFFRRLETLSDMEQIYEHLKKVFPHEAGALERIGREALALCRVMECMATAPNLLFKPWREVMAEAPGWVRSQGASLKGLPTFSRLMSRPVEEYLGTFVRDPDLIRFLAVGYRGNPAAFSLSFLYSMMDYYYPAHGGVQALPDLLARCITESGGEVRCGCLVEKILVEKGRAAGGVTRDGETFRAPFVINNGDARRTFAGMLPGEEVPEAFRRRLDRSRVSESVFSVYLGVDIPPGEIATRGCAHLFLMPTYRTRDLNEMHWNPDFFRDALLMVMVPTLQDPALAPGGKSVVILQCAASEKSLDRWGTRGGKRTEKYRALKKEVARQLIANAETVLPGLSERIELQIESTPLTLQRYTLNSEGAAVGWTYHPRETFRGGLKGVFGRSNTPVKNLYQVGHWTLSPGGAPAALLSAKLVSSVIAKRLRWGL